MTEQVRASARQSALQSISDKAATVQDKGDTTPTIEVHFDPTVLGGFRSAVRNMLALMVFRIQVSEKMAALADVLPAHIDQTLAEALKPAARLSSRDAPNRFEAGVVRGRPAEH